MTNRAIRIVATLFIGLGILAAASTAAGPLRVTYYYLPG